MVMHRLLIKSANMLPAMGTIRNAMMDGPKRSVTACMFAIAFGAAPMPKPQAPEVSTAESQPRPATL